MINNPKFRFNTFRNQWRTIKLGKVFKQTTNYVNPKLQNIELWSLTVEKGLTPKTDRYNRSFLVKKENQFKAVSDGEFIYNPMNITLGAIDLNNTGNQVAVSGYYVTMKIMNDFDKNYFNVWLKLPLAINLYKSFATGSLIEKQRVQFPTFSLVSAAVPGIDEQKKIGKFFSDLEETISLHQQELDALKQTKQGFLQKMFPKQGESEPQLRFSGFKEKWNEKKLIEIVDFFNNNRIPIEAENRIKGNYAYYGASGIIDYVENYIFDGEYVLLAEDGANIITRSSPIAYITQGKFWVNNHAHVMRMKTGSNFFLLQQLERQNYKKFNSGTAQPKLNAKIVHNINISIPTENEQIKIGEFFKQLDEVIDLKEQELEVLKKTKQGFLQKMFV